LDHCRPPLPYIARLAVLSSPIAFFFSSRRRHTRFDCDWSSDVCSSDLDEVAAFEREFAEQLGARHALCVNAGSSALICGLIGAGVGPGDEVIVPAYTWNATPNAVIATGALPVLAEIDDSLTLDPADVEARITPRTKAILPVHMRGAPADMRTLTELAHEHGLVVAEDVCQAAGASFEGRRLGT